MKRRHVPRESTDDAKASTVAAASSRNKRPRTDPTSNGNFGTVNSNGTRIVTTKNATIPSTTTSTTTTKQCLQQSLTANRRLQHRILQELQTLSQRKKENRCQADTCLIKLQQQWGIIVVEGTVTKEGNISAATAAATTKRGTGSPTNDSSLVPTAKDMMALFPQYEYNNMSRLNSKKNSKKIIAPTNFNLIRNRKPYRYDPNRKWTLEYFVDPTGSRPQDNPDVIQRKRLRGQNSENMTNELESESESLLMMESTSTNAATTTAIPDPTGMVQGVTHIPIQRMKVGDFFFYHTSPPFTKQERIVLDKLLLMASSSSSSSSSHDVVTGTSASPTATILAINDTDDVDENGSTPSLGRSLSYHDIAKRLQVEIGMKTVKGKSSFSARLSTALPRTARDVQLYHQHIVAFNHTFSQRQSTLLLDLLQKQQQQQLQQYDHEVEHEKQLSASTTTSGGCDRIERSLECDIESVRVIDQNSKNNQGNGAKGWRPDWVAICNALLKDCYHQAKTAPVRKLQIGGYDCNNNCDRDNDDNNTKDHQRDDDDNDDSLSEPITPQPPITPYQCMVQYKTKLLPQMMKNPNDDDNHHNGTVFLSKGVTSTAEEDELLLRYLAAMGPQFVWDMQQISHLCSRLFRNKVPRRLYERTTVSLWNPLATTNDADGRIVENEDEDRYDDDNNASVYWTRSEEQMLVLAMKIYSGGRDGDSVEVNDDENVDDDHDEDGNESITIGGGGRGKPVKKTVVEAAAPPAQISAIRMAAAHFLPHRPIERVMRKWERSLDPKMSYQPFTIQEDTKLMDIIRASVRTISFADIARDHFPNRSRAQIYQRLGEIMTMARKNGGDNEGEESAYIRAILPPPFPTPRVQCIKEGPTQDDGKIKGGNSDDKLKE
jgi:hypothetical protein